MKLITIEEESEKELILIQKQNTQKSSRKKRSGISEKIQSFSAKISNSKSESKRSKMVYSYTPTYYSSLHDSITSLCKTILPFNFKKKRLQGAEQKLSKLQSDNLKWQQDSFHQMLNLMGLHKEGILAETEVSAFRTHLLDTLIASPAEQEQTVILRDKLLFLQELLYAKCISSEEYHSSKRPLLQRLAVQGAEIEAKDSSNSKSKSKQSSAKKQMKGAASVLGFVSSYKPGKHKEEKSIFDLEESKLSASAFSNHELGKFGENHFGIAICRVKKMKRAQFSCQEASRQSRGSSGGCSGGDRGRPNNIETPTKSAKKHWGFDGFKKWSKNDSEDETAPLPLNERSDSEVYSNHLVASPIGEGPDTKLIKKKLHKDGSPSDFFIDKVLGDKIKKELSRIQTELSTTNPNLQFSNDQIEAISTKLPVDKAELKNFFPKSWCDRYGDVVLDVVKKEFKDHVGEMENMRSAAREKHSNNSKRWTTFDDDDDENCHPNLFATHQNHNPFWSPRHGG
ncbi:hypothetical protein G4B88_004926 [Cannabis sativa]|uniref:Uncharacterized protein n=1 Tax=Cannabis sativa TaxID=3483 RepID=A0A7J6DJG2_CANSA|nr:hypothetical protein G4B88_004926 [Cannabis sativa]